MVKRVEVGVGDCYHEKLVNGDLVTNGEWGRRINNHPSFVGLAPVRSRLRAVKVSTTVYVNVIAPQWVPRP